MTRLFAALAIGVLAALALSVVIGGFALIVGVVVFAIACTVLLKPSPRPLPDELPLGGPLIASLVLAAAIAPLTNRKPFETEWDAAERKRKAIEDAVGDAVEAAGTAVELGSAYVDNVIDYLADD